MERIKEIAKLFGVSFFILEYRNDEFIIKDVGDEYAKKFGFTNGVTPTLNFFVATAIHHDDIERVQKAFRLNAKDGAVFSCVFRGTSIGHGFVWHKLRAKVMKSEDDTLLYYVTFIDLAEQKEEELELREIDFLRNLAISNADVNLWQLNLETNVATLTENCKKIHGFHTDTLENFPQCLYEKNLIRGDSVFTMNDVFRRLKRGEKSVTADIWTRHNARKGWWCERVTYTNIYNEYGQPIRAIGIGRNITEEIKDKTARIKYETAIKESKIMTWEYDIVNHTSVHEYNTRVKFGLLGYVENAPHSIVDMGIIDTDSIEDYLRLYAKVASGAPRASAEIKMFDKDCNELWYKITLITVFDDNGVAVRAIGFAEDLTQIKEMARRYEDELDFQNEIVDTLVMVKVRINITRNCVESFSAKKAANSYVYPGMNYEECIVALSNTAYTNASKQAILFTFGRENVIKSFAEGKTSLSVEYQRVLDDGNVIWVKTEARLMQKPDSNELVAFFYSDNVNQEKMMKMIIDELVESDYEYFGIIDINSGKTRFVSDKSGMSALNLNDITGNFDYVNGYAERIVYVVPEQYEEAVANLNLNNIIDKLKTKKIVEFTHRTIMRKGDESYRRWKFSYMDKNKTLILFTRSDVTDTVKTELEQKEALEKALQQATAANIAKSDFLSRMSHDIRTPMNGILGLIDLSMDMEMSEEMRDNINKMYSSSKFLLNLINDTLDMNKIESKRITLNPQPVVGVDFMSNIVVSIENTARIKGVKFNVTYDNVPIDNHYVMVDVMRVQQIYMNILGNAIKFTPEGGEVELYVKNIRCDGKKHYTTFRVTDTGCGISREFLPKIFEPFEQERNDTNMATTGTGLGMSIVKSLVELMGGKIEVQSELNEGTTMTVWLDFPVAKESDLPKKVVETDGDVSLDGKNILLCEDHPLNTEIAKRILERAGCTVVTAADGKIGCEKFLKSRMFFFDAIIMDIRMPVMDGLQAAKTIRAYKRADAQSVPIIAMTANAFDDDMRKSKEAGMNAHLSKPVEPGVLISTMKKYCK